MDERPGLLGEGVRHHGMGVAKRVHRDPGHEVQVLVAVDVPDTGALATFDDHGLAPVVLKDVAVFFGDPVSHGNLQASHGSC
ncbi:MAG: hypothetical protein AMXMBFR80_26250 [Dehalococcoidia bacterium]